MGQHELDTLAVNTIRFLAADAVQRANSGHPGLPMGAAQAAYVLWTRHLKHAPTYRDEVLPPDLGPRLAVEMGVSLGWHRWIAPRGDVLALDRFGASAPGDRVIAELGFTPEHVAERAVRLVS
jgi:transketolase